MLWKSGVETMNKIIQTYPSTITRPIKTCESHAAVKLVTPRLFLTAGSGGMMTAYSVSLLDRYHYPSIPVEHSVAKSIDMRSPAEHVANIRHILAINMSELASILGITRPTAYAWLEGQEPKPEAVTHIQRLSQTADEINRANIIQLDQLIRRPVLNGRSLLDIIKANEDPSKILCTLKSISEKEARTRRESTGSGKNLRSLDDVSSEYSVAIYERS
jgi:DNA-binding transcriptional regulator YiaG